MPLYADSLTYSVVRRLFRCNPLLVLLVIIAKFIHSSLIAKYTLMVRMQALRAIGSPVVTVKQTIRQNVGPLLKSPLIEYSRCTS